MILGFKHYRSDYMISAAVSATLGGILVLYSLYHSVRGVIFMIRGIR